MTVTIHQPDFLPWLGFFDRWLKSDLYIVLDDVQFLRRGWQNRDRIKTSDGAAWLTVPVLKKGRYDQLIRDVMIDDSTPWRSNHLKTIGHNYKKAPNFDRCFKEVEKIYGMGQKRLMDFNMSLLSYAASELGIKTPIAYASTFHVTTKASERLIDLVKAVGGKRYMTGTGSRDYLNEELFAREGIEVIWHEYKHPVYDQLSGDFIPELSVIDYLMMRGT